LAEPTPGSPAAPGGALALEALDEHGVVGERRRVVDQAAEELVVGGGADAELAPDRLLLGAGVPPPMALELEDATLALPERPRGRRRVLLPCVILHVLIPAVLRREGPGCVPGPADRTPKMLYRAEP
jgi:hypothetical protein